jgi:hypothetical protein
MACLSPQFSRGGLHLISWRISSAGQVTRLSTLEPGISIRSVDVAWVWSSDDPERLIHTACSNAEGNLLVSEWRVESDGRMSHRSSLTFGGASKVAMGRTGGVSMVDSDGRRRVIDFRAPLQRRSTAVGGKISAITTMGQVGWIWLSVTASQGPIGVRTGLAGGGRLLLEAGRLELILWDQRHTTDPVRKAERELGGVSGLATEVAAAGPVAKPPGSGALYVSAHTGFGSFKKLLPKDQGKRQLTFTVWEADDKSLKKRSTLTRVGDFRSVCMVAAPGGLALPPQLLASAFCDASNNLRMLVLRIS